MLIVLHSDLGQKMGRGKRPGSESEFGLLPRNILHDWCISLDISPCKCLVSRTPCVYIYESANFLQANDHYYGTQVGSAISLDTIEDGFEVGISNLRYILILTLSSVLQCRSSHQLILASPSIGSVKICNSSIWIFH